jgi:hypothetical protein
MLKEKRCLSFVITITIKLSLSVIGHGLMAVFTNHVMKAFSNIKLCKKRDNPSKFKSVLHKKQGSRGMARRDNHRIKIASYVRAPASRLFCFQEMTVHYALSYV